MRATPLFSLVLALAALPGTARADDPKPPPPPPPGTPNPEPNGPQEPLPAPAPPAAPGEPDAASRAKVVAIVDDLRAEASEIRGLKWKTKVEADLLSRDQLKKKMEEMIKEDFDQKEYDRDVKVMRRLGLLTKDEDPLEMTKRFLEKGIAGYYNPKTKRLYLIDGVTGDAQRPTILHELIHALEDQYVDLDKTLEAVKKDGDRVFALKCVVEGSAEHGRMLYEARHPEWARLSAKEQSKGENMAELRAILKVTPEILFLPTLLQYQLGPALVGRVVGKEYANGMERLYADPPKTEEQCLHPGKFVTDRRDLPRTCTWPKGLAEAVGEGWTGTELQGFGELEVVLWLDRWLGKTGGRLDMATAATGRFWSKEAQTAAEGWDGVWVQVLETKGEARGVALASAWDSPLDAREAGEAFLAALSAQYGAAFHAGSWSLHDGALDYEFDDTNGSGRLEVRGDEVRFLDGVPASALGSAWGALETATFSRDPKDTWKPSSGFRAPPGSAWSDEGSRLSWTPPDDGWKVEKGEAANASVLRRGDLAVRVRVYESPLGMVMMGLRMAMQKNSPDVSLGPDDARDVKLAGKEAGRIDYDTQAGASPAAHHVVVLVPLGNRTLVVASDVPTEAWAAAGKDLETALGGFASED